MGDFEVLTLVGMESSVEYHPAEVLNLTLVCYESIRRINDEPETILKLCSVFFMVQKLVYVLVIHTRPGTVPGG